MWHCRGSRRAVRPGSMVPLRSAMPVRAVVRKQAASPFGGKGSPLHPTGTYPQTAAAQRQQPYGVNR